MHSRERVERKVTSGSRDVSAQNVLILTATVTPSSLVPQLFVTDPAERFAQYHSAFALLAKSPALARVKRIVLAENSGFDLSKFETSFQECPVAVEFLSIDTPEVAAYGRGFAEMSLIDKALDVSPLSEHEFAWKITGRYKILNLASIVGVSRSQDDLVINVRRYPKPWVDMHVFGFRALAWEALRDNFHLIKETKDVNSAEIAMYPIIQHLLEDDRFVIRTRLPVEPHIRGSRGSDGREYDAGKQRLKRIVRQSIRLLAPKMPI